MIVKKVMVKDVICLTPDMTFLSVAKLFLKHKISGAPVTNHDGELVGILSEKDLFRAMYPSYKNFYDDPTPFTRIEKLEETAKDAREKTVNEIMVKKVISTTPDTHILKIGALMVATGIHQVPVLNKGKIVGMVSRGTIHRAVLQFSFPELR